MKNASKTPSLNSPFTLIVATTLSLLLVVGFVYTAIQQNYRQNANDPQTQLAGDVAAMMSAGSLPKDALYTYVPQVDPSTSLAPFVTIVDSSGNVSATTMNLNGGTPLPPSGVLSAASTTHQNRVTWQPQTGTRIALVVQAYKHDNNTGYVLAGRSLKEVEVREDMLFWMAATTAVGVMAIGSFTALVYSRRR